MPLTDKEITEFVRHGGCDAVQKLTDALLNSNWPDCIRFATALSQIGNDDAVAGLLRALKGRRHHIRSAAITTPTIIM